MEKIEYAYRCATGQSIGIKGGIGIARDNSGNPLTWSALDTSTPASKIYTKVYSYDQLSRLDSANYPGKGTTDFQYDWAGNRTNPNAMEYNASDQLTRWPNQHRYEYDGRGNLIYEKSDSNTTQKTYSYTYSNLTSSISYIGVNKSSLMTWDTDGNRITFQSSTRSNDSDTYIFVYDTTAGIPAVGEEVTPSCTNSYIREPSGALIARVSTVGETETALYYHYDELGSTQFLTATDGTVTDKYTYDAWGNVISHIGNTQQPYQYVGESGYYLHYDDSNLPYVQTGVRLYNNKVGRYIQKDVYPEIGTTAYSYVGNKNTIAVDPTGKTISYHLKIIQGVPHGFICINGECRGFYPVSEKMAMLDCCTGVYRRFGICCWPGEVRNDNKWYSSSTVLSSRQSSKKEEATLWNNIHNWEKGFHMWCLAPFYPSSDNCWTWIWWRI